jgi:hypothetical protein
MATYLNDLRLTELATGEGSGTWGTTTNTSLELIGEALGYATQQVFGSDADATTTIADGASDPARAMYFKITSAGSLTATRTCTIAPNTISRVMFIENATTGSQSIAISQGSGASVTILAGKTAVVYLDGAGAGAAVVDAMAGVDPGVTDTLAEVLAAGNTSGANNLIIDNGQAITTNTINETTAASGVTIDSVLLKDDGVNATNLEITNLKANDGTSAGSIADSTGVVTLASSVLTTADINGGTIDGTTLGATTPASVAATTLSTTGIATFNDNVYIPTNTAGMFLGSAGVFEYGVSRNGTTLQIHSGSATPRLTINGTTGAATFSGNVDLTNGIVSVLQSTANSDVFYGRTSSVAPSSYIDMYLGVGNSNGGFPDRAAIIRAQNHSSGTDRSDLVFLTANSAAPAEALRLDYLKNATFSGTVTATQFSSTNSNASTPSFGVSAGNGMYNAGTNILGFSTNSLNRMTLNANGNLGIGQSNPGSKFVVAVSDAQGLEISPDNATEVSFLTYNRSTAAYIDLKYRANKHEWYTGATGVGSGMTLDASGNLGLGRAPTKPLDVLTALTGEQTVAVFGATNYLGSAATYIQIGTQYRDASSRIGSISPSGNTSALVFQTHDATTEVWNTGMTLDASSNLLVGASSSPQISAGSVARIQVIAESSGATAFAPSLPASATGTSIRSQSVTAAGTGWNHFVGSSGNGSSLTANNIFIYGNGDIGNTNNSYGAISDAKLKENITDATPKLAGINAVRIVNYNLIDHPEVKQLGVIAQELEQIFPGMVSEAPDRDMEGNDLGTVTKSVKYSVFVPMLIKAIQEQQSIIESLTTRIEALEGAK